MKSKTIGYTTGIFDPFHIGHVNFLRNAKKLCDILIVAVKTTERVRREYHVTPSTPFHERMDLVRSLSFVDMVVSENVEDTEVSAWQNLKFDVVFPPRRIRGTDKGNQLEEQFTSRDVSVIYLPETPRQPAPRVEPALSPLDYMRRHLKTPIPHRMIGFFEEKRDEIEGLTERLLEGMDPLSHAVARRFILFYRQCAFLRSEGRKVGVDLFETGPYIQFPVFYTDLEKEEFERQKRVRENTRIPDYRFPETDWPYNPKISFRNLYPTKRSLDFLDPDDWDLSGKDVLDCGAYGGDSALILSDLSPRSVHAFEPSREVYDYLVRVLKANQKENIVPVNAATGSRCEPLKLYDSRDFGLDRATVHPVDGWSGRSVECTTIDRYVQSHSLDVGLIKMDVEGAEYESIVGALETIKKDRPVLVVGIYHAPRDLFEIKPLLESLDLGYRFVIRQSATVARVAGDVELLAYIPPRRS